MTEMMLAKHDNALVPAAASLHDIPKKRVKEMMKKEELSFEESLAVIAFADAKIRAAKEQVFDEPKNKNGEELKHSPLIAASFGVQSSALFAGILVDTPEMVFAGSAGFVAIAVTAMSSIGNSERCRKLRRFFTPKKYKQNEFAFGVEQELHAASVQRFKAIEEKFLKKTVKAVETVNENLHMEEIVYDGGFVTKEKPAVQQAGPWDRILMRNNTYVSIADTVEYLKNRKIPATGMA